MAATWATLPEHPFIRHTQARAFEARRRDAVVSVEAAPNMDVRRRVDRLAGELPVLTDEAAVVAAVARAVDVARQLPDSAGLAAMAYAEALRVPPPADGGDRRAVAGYVVAVRANEAVWADARARANRALARAATGFLEDDGETVVSVAVAAPVLPLREKEEEGDDSVVVDVTMPAPAVRRRGRKK